MDLTPEHRDFLSALSKYAQSRSPDSIANRILMELSFEHEVERLQVAEEAVRIVKNFSRGKPNKREQSERLVNLCTEIANIIDINKRLQRVVRKQEHELDQFRAGGSKTSGAASESTLGLLTPVDREGLTPQPILASPSSGRGTSLALRETGTDPLFDWPGRPPTQSRATSPLKTSIGLWSSRGSSDSSPDSDYMEGKREEDYMDDFVEESGTEDQPDGHSDTADNTRDSITHENTGNATDDKGDVEEKDEDDGEQEEHETEENAQQSHEMSTQVKEVHAERQQQKETKVKQKPNTSHNSNQEQQKSSEKPKPSQKKKAESKATHQKDGKGKERMIKKEKTRTKKSEDGTQQHPHRKEPRKTTNPKAASSQKNNEGDKANDTSPKSSADKSRKESSKEGKEEGKNANEKASRESKTSLKARRRKGKSPLTLRKCAPKSGGREGSGKSVSWYSSDSSLDSDESENEDSKRKIRPELTTEYWEIHRLVKFLRVGNPTVTIIALCALQDFTLEQEACQVSLIDLEAFPILLNLLNTDYYPCVLGSLKVLRRVSCSRRVNTELYRIGGVQQLVGCLDNESLEVRSLATECLSKVVSFRKAYSAIRKHKGIEKLITLLKPQRRSPSYSRMYTKDQSPLTLSLNACNALWSCSKSARNIRDIRAGGAVPILASLLIDGNHDMILPIVGIIKECSNDASFRDDIRKAGLIESIVLLLASGDDEMKTLCASAIYKCAEDEETRELVLKHGGLEPMIEVLATKPCVNTELLGAVAGAVWKCALHNDSLRWLDRLGTLNCLIYQIKCEHPLNVMSNLIGALCEFAYSKRNILRIYEDNVLNILIQKLNLTEPAILISCIKLLELCAKEALCRSYILNSDGLRLMWSLLKSTNHQVVASAADGISVCAVKPQESAEIVRSFVGGLELVTNLLRSNRREVLLSVCRLIINIGRDKENLSIMTDYDVIPILVTLIYTPDDEEMRRYVAEAIATCCNLEKNIPALSSTVVPLADGLSTFKSVQVHRSTALALEKLSQDPHNCYLIHKHGALKHLKTMMGSTDETVQHAAANCTKNLRISVMMANS